MGPTSVVHEPSGLESARVQGGHEPSGLEPDGPEDSSGLDSLGGSIALAARSVSLPAITPANRRASQPPSYICGHRHIGADGAAPHLISTTKSDIQGEAITEE